MKNRQRAAAAALALAWVAAGPAAGGQGLVVRFILDSEVEGDVEVAVRVESDAGGEPMLVEASAPGTVVIEPRLPLPWRLTTSARGYWIAPRHVDSISRQDVEIRLLPATELRASVRVPEGNEAPRSLSLRLRAHGLSSADDAPDFEDAVVDCPLDGEGRLRCEVPAASGLDLRLRAPGFASRFFWDVDLGEAAQRDLGRLTLQPGGSLVGTVEVPPRLDVREVVVALDEGRRSARDAARDDTIARLETRPDTNGFFAFEGLGSGTYRLSARLDGLAPAELEPVPVIEGSQTEVEAPLVLAPPEPIRFTIDPPFDPDSADWRIRLFREHGPGQRSARADAEGAAVAGFVAFEGIGLGRYEVDVVDSRDVVMQTAHVEHRSGGGIHSLAVEAVRVQGTVTLGTEPLLARMTFRGRSRSVMETDHLGRLDGILPHEGEWDVELEAIEPTVRWRRRDVQIVAKNGIALLDLSLPDHRIEGVVVDEQNRPREEAVVTLDQPLTGRPVTMLSGEDGRFDFRGLAEESYQVQATVGDELQSEPATVEVQEGVVPDLRLVLRPKLELRGRVVDGAGNPLPGVGLEVEPRFATGIVDAANSNAATTDATGAFRSTLPSTTSAVHLTVLAPGFALRQLLVDPGDVGDVVVQPAGGTLVVHLPEPVAWTDPDQPRPFLVNAAGHRLFLGFLAEWARLNGIRVDPGSGELVIPQLEVGSYRVCWMTARDLADPTASGVNCQPATVSVGGTPHVELIAPP